MKKQGIVKDAFINSADISKIDDNVQPGDTDSNQGSRDRIETLVAPDNHEGMGGNSLNRKGSCDKVQGEITHKRIASDVYGPKSLTATCNRFNIAKED